MLTNVLTLVIALILDRVLGEPLRFHPLVGFGSIATTIERSLNRVQANRWHGLLALLICVVPLTMGLAALTQLPWLGLPISVLVVYLSIGHQSLRDHAEPIAEALEQNDDLLARELASRIVSRDAESLDVSKATTESVLENGNDAVFAAIFWFVLAGVPGALAYRLVNTLDAMWGYKKPRYRQFGWAAARLDDVLNFIPARLTALTYALLGQTQQAIRSWYLQGSLWESPNAGPVMAAGAGALGVSLGGAARYGGEWHQRIELGTGGSPDANTIRSALALVQKGLWLWVFIIVVIGLAWG